VVALALIDARSIEMSLLVEMLLNGDMFFLRMFKILGEYSHICMVRLRERM